MKTQPEQQLKAGPRRPLLWVVGGSYGYARPWMPLFGLADTKEEAEVCLFTGGADISPQLYGENNVASHPYPERDRYEVEHFHYFRDRRVPMIGICRGAQLICALMGGKLFQDVSHHAGQSHTIVTYDGRELRMNSLHHQMMRPSGNYRIVAHTKQPLSRRYVFEGNPDNTTPDFVQGDPEIVLYPEIKALCIQGHPEMLDTHHPTNEYIRELAKRYLLA